MELSREQIQYLYDFVTSKYVRYEDVKHEIVDHLACAIEDRMSENPELTFERALQLVYRKFPITGFAQWILEKEKALQIYWRKKLGKAFLRWLFSKDILAPLAIALCGFMVFKLVPYGFQLIAISTIIYSLSSIYIFHRKKIKEKAEKYLSTSILMQYNIASGFIFYFSIYNEEIWLFKRSTEVDFQSCLIFIVLTLQCLFSYYQNHCFPKLMEGELKKINRLSIAS